MAMPKCDMCDKESGCITVDEGDYKYNLCPTCNDKRKQEQIDELTTEVLDKLTHEVNGGSPKDLGESLCRSMQRQHRTLQQNVIGALFVFIKEYAKIDSDLRNEGSVEACKKLLPVLEETYLPYI